MQVQVTRVRVPVYLLFHTLIHLLLYVESTAASPARPHSCSGATTAYLPPASQSPLEFPAQIISRSQINTASDFPVFNYKLQLQSEKDWAAFSAAAEGGFSGVGAGCRVYMTLPPPVDGRMKKP